LISKDRDGGASCPHILLLHVPTENLVLPIAGACGANKSLDVGRRVDVAKVLKVVPVLS
jgi:hypothetical protein